MNEIGDPDGGLGFVVAGAAAVEVAVLFGEDEGIERPVFALGFDDVGVGEEEERLLLAGAVVADDEVELFVDGAAEGDVGIGEAGGFEASGGGFGDRSGGAGGVAGADFDEFLVDVVGELFFGVGAGGLGVGGSGDEEEENATATMGREELQIILRSCAALFHAMEWCAIADEAKSKKKITQRRGGHRGTRSAEMCAYCFARRRTTDLGGDLCRQRRR